MFPHAIQKKGKPQNIISVLMSARNGERHVAEAVKSVLDQSLREFEFVVTDHRSSDGTPEILASFAAADERLKIFRFEADSFVDCLNFGLGKCNGKYVARFDCDDLMHEDRLRLQKEYLDTHPQIGIVGSRVEMFAEDGVMEGYSRYEKWINTLLEPEEIVREMFIESPMPNPSVMVRREIFEGLGGYKDFGWPEDYDFYLRAMLAGVKMSKIDQPLLRWRDHSNRITRNHPRYSRKSFLKVRACYLARIIGKRGTVLQGGGTTGRIFGKYLKQYGVRLEALLDVNQRRIGEKKIGLPVHAMEDMPRFKGKVLLSAVSSWGARELIRQEALKHGFTEGEDFFCCS